MKILKLIKEIPLLGNLIYSFYRKIKELKIHKNNISRVKQLVIPKGKKIFYLDIPIHSNLGDIAQYLCTKKWLNDNYQNYNIVEIDGLIISDLKCGMLEKIAENATDEDIIFFQSGYCTQDLGGYHDLVHKEIIKACPNTPIVMLPQTVFYQNEENEKEATSIYTNNNNILFLARDFVSKEKAEKLFPTLCVEAYPDIVTTMIGKKQIKTSNRDGVIFCIRNDSEKYYTDEQINDFMESLKSKCNVSIFDTTIRKKFDEIKNDLSAYIDNIINKLSTAKVVVTDRYHGTIFSLVANTPVVVIKTTDHKVKTGVEWFKGVYDEYVYYADSLDDAKRIVNELLSKERDYKLNSYFNETYYSRLKEKIEIWRNKNTNEGLCSVE